MAFIIAIDGLTASGKGTLAKRIAQYYKLHYLDTGLLYRIIAAEMILGDNISMENKSVLEKKLNLLMHSKKFEQKIIDYISRQNTNNERSNKKQSNASDQSRACNDSYSLSDLRSEQISKAASIISTYKIVRTMLKKIQIEFSKKEPGSVMDGRDIATVICPNANIKLYIHADINIRAKRRYLEQKQIEKNIHLEIIQDKIKQRDQRDLSRQHAPLKKAKDAIMIDTTHLDIDQAFEKAVSLINPIFHKG